jgi:ferredoxin-NADP reductase
MALWKEHDRYLTVVLSCECTHPGFSVPSGLRLVDGPVAEAIESVAALPEHDAYVAGPIAAIPSIVDRLEQKGVRRDRIFVDCFGGS